MYRIQVGILCLVMVFVFGLALNVAGQDKSEPEAAVEDMCVPMGVIELKPDPSVEQKKSSVEFDHGKHFNYDTKIANCSTSDCHDLLKAPKRPTKYLVYTKEGIKYYKYAYHQNCIGCHKEIKVERKRLENVYLAAKKELPKTGPTSCKECHPKE
ncbi:MAG: cytochrome c3 family protein [Deltaproteobacteria bacterium]|nr:cytochrome c3 family protein [Deltaproteobacteria bacterium]